MFAILGILIVIGAVSGGYLMEKGNLLVLMQPSELVIIGGAAVGTVLISNPPHILKQILKGMAAAFAGSRYTKARYLDSLKLLFELFDHARRSGLASLEPEVEEPEKGKIFRAHPALLKDQHFRDFVCDTLRTMMVGGLEPFDLDQLMEADMDAHHREAGDPVGALSQMADSLPGLGIVAAVLGVVITMGALGGKPEEIGHKVAAALVGTFLGILLCYGFIGPLAASMAKAADAEHAYYQVLRAALAAYHKGAPPMVAVEIGRRSMPGHLRPNFQEMERTCRSKGVAAKTEAAA